MKLVKINADLKMAEYLPIISDYKSKLREAILQLQELSLYSCTDSETLKACIKSLNTHYEELDKLTDDSRVTIYDPIP